MALPITQHDRVWVLYLKFLMQPGIPVETAVRVGGRAGVQAGVRPG